MATILTTKICLRNDLAANWAQVNPLLLSGELGFERDTGLFKIGNGELNWNDLPYAGGNTTNENITVSVDGQTITKTEAGVIGLHNWGKEYYAWNEPADNTQTGHYTLQVVDNEHPWIANLVPRAAIDINSNIVIAWYESIEERIAASIAALHTSVNNLNSAIGNSEDNAETDTIYGRIASKLDVAGGTLTGELVLADGSKAISEKEVDTKIAALGSIGTLKREIVETLPPVEQADTNTIYMVKRAELSTLLTGDVYDEYIVIEGAWEQIGNTKVDLSNYVEKVVPTIQDVFAGLDAAGALLDTGIAIKDVEEHLENDIIHITKEERTSWNNLYAITQPIKYEVTSSMPGMKVRYSDQEIRVMFPADTQWTSQQVGSTGNSNMHYFAFKAYAPSNAVSFKEDTAEIIGDQTMHSFENNSFAGIDKYGRKYSIVWLAAASNNNGTWTYFGANSTKEHYMGWYYNVEWYNADGEIIGSDLIRINLSNEDCHDVAEPYYMGRTIKNIKLNGTLLDMVNNTVEINTTAIIKESDEITINEDGSLSIKSISADKLTTTDDTELILNGGSAAVKS